MKKENPPKPKLFQFAFFPTFNDSVAFLADNMADAEDWEFSDAKTNNYSILKSYLFHIFDKLESENKILSTTENKYACFNTGLVTRNLEQIYAYFESNNRVSSTQAFVFKAFLRESDNTLLQRFKGGLPNIANFFQHPEELIFNPNCKIIPQIDHIIEDNKDRFPPHMLSVGEDETRRRLDGAISEVRKRVKTNYKLAVPQYHKGRIQLLLPLCLTPGTTTPDIALVTHRIDSETYTARTCLTLKMAYNNARLIVKPQSSWLKP